MCLSASAQLITSNTKVKYRQKNPYLYNRVGLSYNYMYSNTKGYLGVRKISDVSGVSLSWTLGYGLSKNKPLFVESGVGATYATDGLKCAIFTVPVNLTYKIAVSENIKLAPFAGITFNVPTSINNDYFDDNKSFYMGWQAGANVEFGKFYIGVSYNGGLMPIAEGDFDDKYKLNAVSGTLGIVF